VRGDGITIIGINVSSITTVYDSAVNKNAGPR